MSRIHLKNRLWVYNSKVATAFKHLLAFIAQCFLDYINDITALMCPYAFIEKWMNLVTFMTIICAQVMYFFFLSHKHTVRFLWVLPYTNMSSKVSNLLIVAVCVLFLLGEAYTKASRQMISLNEHIMHGKFLCIISFLILAATTDTVIISIYSYIYYLNLASCWHFVQT